jgi:hypothetical protein
MHFPASSSRQISSATEAARQALLARQGQVRPPPDPDAERQAELLIAVAEGDDGAFTYRMLRAAWRQEPTLDQFGDRLETLRAGLVSRYALLAAEIERADADGTAEEPACDTAPFLARSLFLLDEFEALAPDAFLVAAFSACLKRPPDPFALAHYRKRLEAVGRAGVLAQLIQSDEAKQRSLATIVIGVGEAETGAAAARELAALDRRNRQLEYLTGFLQAQCQSLAVRLARLEQRG